LRPTVKRLRIQKVWRELALNLRCGWQSALGGTDIQPPWPDIMIATGRTSVVASLYVKRAAGSRTFVVQLQNPRLSLKSFDRVIAPAHDELTGDNVIQTIGAMHRVTPRLLNSEAIKWAPRFAHLPRPLVAVALGGSNSSYRFGLKETVKLGEQLVAFSRITNAGLLVTPSRRTGNANVAQLRAILRDCGGVIWDGAGDNPYYGILGLANAVIVTCDSINMISEACSTGKPVYIVQLPGYSRAFTSFQRRLIAADRIRPFNGGLQSWQYEPLRETDQVAQQIRTAYEARAG